MIDKSEIVDSEFAAVESLRPLPSIQNKLKRNKIKL